MMRQSTILIFAILVGLLACKGKQDKLSSASIIEITSDIAKTNVLMGGAVGIAGERPKQWDRYDVLRSKGTDKELLALTSDTNAVVRCYAFQAKLLIEQLLKDPNRQTDGFAAVVNFPDLSFFPVLQQTLRNEITKNNGGNNERLQWLYQAIVQYKDQPSRQLLQSVLNEAKGMQSIYHKDYLHQAIKLYPATIYDGLLKPIFSSTPTEKSGT
jgi:dTDP-4-amino-4,6-dideoxygalactose transaminase